MLAELPKHFAKVKPSGRDKAFQKKIWLLRDLLVSYLYILFTISTDNHGWPLMSKTQRGGERGHHTHEVRKLRTSLPPWGVVGASPRRQDWAPLTSQIYSPLLPMSHFRLDSLSKQPDALFSFAGWGVVFALGRNICGGPANESNSHLRSWSGLGSLFQLPLSKLLKEPPTGGASLSSRCTYLLSSDLLPT